MRSPTSRRAFATTLALLVAATLAMTGCDTRQAEESRVEDHSFELTDAARAIDVRIGEGSITVSPSSTGSVEISIKSVARSLDRNAALGLLDVHTVTAETTPSGVVVRGPSAGGDRFVLGGIETNVSIAVPGSVELTLRTDDGRIEIEDLEGTVRAESGDGRIRVRNLRGRLTLRTWDGTIVARDVDGALEASSEDGSVEVDGRFDSLRVETADGRLRAVCREGSRVESPWLLRSADGSVTLELPESIDASLEAIASDGSIENRLSGFRGTTGRFRVRGELGEGGHELFVATLDGSIELREDDR